jgi:hypothetical protein
MRLHHDGKSGGSMTYDPAKRDSSWTKIQPGCYIDPAGRGHIFPDEIVAQLQIDHPEAGFDFGRADYDLIVDTYVDMLRQQFQACRVQFIHHEREKAS